MSWWHKPETPKPPVTETIIAGGTRWKKVNAPVKWEAQPGDVLVGTFVGIANRRGAHGPYQAVIVDDGTTLRQSITGSMIVSLVETSGVQPGDRVCIVCGGTKVSVATQFTYKVFSLYVIDDGAVRKVPSFA